MKWKPLLCLILSALLLSSCAIVAVEPTAPTKTTRTHSLERYTQWIGHPAQNALEALGDAKTVEFMGLPFSLSPLTEGELFSGVELNAQLNDPNGQVADTVWDLMQGMYKEYLAVVTYNQNVYSDAGYFTRIEEKEYYENLEIALDKRGSYVFDVSWNLDFFTTDECDALLDQMGARVLEETKQQFKDSTIDYIWSVSTRLDLLLEVTIWDANRADVNITCKALAEPAAGMDLDIKLSDRDIQFFKVSYERLLEEKNLFVLGYGFQTTEGNASKTWEEIYFHGDDFLYIVDNGISQKIYLQVDGIQYKTVYRNGEYAPWEVLTETMAHPLPWRDAPLEIVFADTSGGGVLTGSEYLNVIEGHRDLSYNGINVVFWTKANCIYRAEYKTTEEQLIGGDYVITDYRRVLDISIITEQEATAAIEKYKALLP